MCEERVLDSTDTCTMREAHASDNYALRESHVSAMEASEVEESSASSDAEIGSSFCTMAIERQVTVWLGELVSAVIVIADLELQAGSKVVIHADERVLDVLTAPTPLPDVVQHLLGADLPPAALEYREFYLKAVWAVDAPLSPLWNVEIDTDTSLILVPGHAEVLAAESRRVALEEAYTYSLEALLCPPSGSLTGVGVSSPLFEINNAAAMVASEEQDFMMAEPTQCSDGAATSMAEVMAFDGKHASTFEGLTREEYRLKLLELGVAVLGARSTVPTPEHVEDTGHGRLWAVERDGSESDATIATALTAANGEAREAAVSILDGKERAGEKAAAPCVSAPPAVERRQLEHERCLTEKLARLEQHAAREADDEQTQTSTVPSDKATHFTLPYALGTTSHELEVAHPTSSTVPSFALCAAAASQTSTGEAERVPVAEEGQETTPRVCLQLDVAGGTVSLVGSVKKQEEYSRCTHPYEVVRIRVRSTLTVEATNDVRDADRGLYLEANPTSDDRSCARDAQTCEHKLGHVARGDGRHSLCDSKRAPRVAWLQPSDDTLEHMVAEFSLAVESARAYLFTTIERARATTKLTASSP